MENSHPGLFTAGELPDDIVGKITDSLRERNWWRARALTLAREQFDRAGVDERGLVFRNVVLMRSIIDEFQAQFPEVFLSGGERDYRSD